MGNDLALAVLSDRAPSLFSYFKQLFAQVTNPAIDPIREKVVMSLSTGIGSELNLLEETREHAHQLVMSQPILRNSELEKLRQVSHDIFRAETIDITWPIDEGPRGMAQAVDRICAEASYAIDRGANIIILSDREVSLRRVPIPSLLAVSSVHNDLVRAGTRLRAGLVIESGEPREVHHMACLIGYGASAINPYLMFESLWELRGRRKLPPGMTAAEAERQVVIAIGKGLLKVLSKMGISTIESYCGAQIFEAVGLHPDLIDDHFTGTPSRIGGVGMDELATRGAGPPRPRLPARQGGAPARGRGGRGPDPARGRHLRLAARRRAPHVGPGDRHAAPAGRPLHRRPRPGVGELRALRRPGQRGERDQGPAARAAEAAHRSPADPGRGGRAGQGDRQALLDRRHVAGRALARVARGARRRP